MEIKTYKAKINENATDTKQNKYKIVLEAIGNYEEIEIFWDILHNFDYSKRNISKTSTETLIKQKEIEKEANDFF